MITTTEFDNLISHREAEIEESLDKAIKNCAEDGRRTVTRQIESDWDYTSIQNVLARYREAGWKADVIADHRDGNFISMTPR